MLKAFSKLPINQSVRILSLKEIKEIRHYEMYQYFDMLPKLKDDLKLYEDNKYKKIKIISTRK